MGLKWHITPSVDPGGSHISLHIEHPSTGARAWMSPTPDEADAIADALAKAAAWCRHKDAA